MTVAPPARVTTTSTGPTAWAGVRTWMTPAGETWRSVPAVPPKVTPVNGVSVVWAAAGTPHAVFPVAPGDLVAVPGTGAYCRSMASNYNHALRPPVIGVRDGKTFTVLRRETVADLLATDVGVSS